MNVTQTLWSLVSDTWKLFKAVIFRPKEKWNQSVSATQPSDFWLSTRSLVTVSSVFTMGTIYKVNARVELVSLANCHWHGLIFQAAFQTIHYSFNPHVMISAHTSQIQMLMRSTACLAGADILQLVWMKKKLMLSVHRKNVVCLLLQLKKWGEQIYTV